VARQFLAMPPVWLSGNGSASDTGVGEPKFEELERLGAHRISRLRWRGNDGEEVGHEVIGGGRVVKKFHDAGWDPVEMAAGLEVGRR
jgi:hypothetical protein